MQLLTEILDHSVAVAPEKPAFGCAGEYITYAELDRSANQLANTLIGDGMSTGDRIGIYLEKSLYSATAIYGILRAGGVYVPLDPAAPSAKTDAIVGACGIGRIVTSSRQSSRIAALASGLSTVVGGEAGLPQSVSWEAVQSASVDKPDVAVAGTDPAYVIFTSGSTGDPKGIVHTHESALAYVVMAAELYDLKPEDRLSNFPPLHFDQSIFDYFSGPLVTATTIILTEAEQLVPASLSKRIEEEQLTIWYSVPFALIQILLWGALDERDIQLRWVVFGGEPFPLTHLKALMGHWPTARFSNCYGPAETNPCTYYHFDSMADAVVLDETRIPIGTPCPNVDVLVVDDDDNPVEDGAEGELLVSGPTTMLSYWGGVGDDPAQFLVRDDGQGQARRYYRTGDVVTSTGGVLDFLGRRDRQIKTRGFRVELDEVEAAFSSHDAVAVAGAYPAVDDSGAVLVRVAVQPVADASTECGLDIKAVRAHASDRLPRYAMPATIDVLSEFPRTASGKINYRKLADEAEKSDTDGRG